MQSGTYSDISPEPRRLSDSLVGLSRYHILVLIVVYSVARLPLLLNLGTPILGWRPADLASIAMNYYRNGFHFLYPQIYWGGNGPGYVEMEFPLIPYLTALLYKLFGVHEWLALVIPYLTGVGLIIVVYLFARYVFDSAVGLVAGVFAGVSPTFAALTTGLWPDPPMVFFGALGLYALARWVKNDSWVYFLVAAFSASVAILLKITALYLGIPILFLCVLKYKGKWWRTPIVWLLAVLILLPPFLWYYHAHTLYEEYGNTFGILSAGYSKFADLEILSSPDFYVYSALRVIMYHLTPFAFCAFAYGFFVRKEGELRHLFYVWFAAVLFYVIVAAKGVVMGHYQYLLPVVPPGAALAGLGTMSLVRKLESLSWFRQSAFKQWLLTLGMSALFLVSTVGATHQYYVRDLYKTPIFEEKRKTGQAVGRITEPGALIIVVDTDMDDRTPERSMTPPDVFYFSDRRGWYLATAWLKTERIEQLRNQGAGYFVVSGQSAAQFTAAHSDIKDYLSRHYRTIMDNGDGIVYDLRGSKNE